MSLVKTSLLNGIAVVVKLATSLILNKVLAVQLGPTGYAVIGQFQNLISMVGAIASGAMNTGVTKYTAEYHSDTERRHAVWRTAAMISCAGGLVIACGLFFARVPIARWAFADESLSGVIVWLAAALLAILLNALLLAILSGIKAVRAFVIANILGSLISAAAATLLVTLFGLYGALVALATSQAVACVATLWLFHAQTETSWRAFIGPFDRTVAAKLGGFALMSISSALLVPIGQLIIRDGLVEQIGWSDAGLWQALGRISETHLLLLTTTLSLYFLPRFSEIKRAAELSAEVRRGIKFVVPLVVLSASFIFFIREPLVHALLSAEFAPLTDLLGWQLLGDVLKISSWVLGFALVSQAMTRQVILTEFTFTGLLVSFSLIGAHLDGLRGTAIGYAATYALYGLTMLYIFRAQLIPKLQGLEKPA